MTHETREIDISTTQWTDITDGALYGLITNNSEHSIRYRTAELQPSVNDTFGHILHPQNDRYFNITSPLKVWALGFHQRARIALTKNFLGPELTRSEVSFLKGPVVDTAERLRVSQREGIFDNKNINSRHYNQWEEHLDGVILEYTTLTGVFTVTEEIRGTAPAVHIPNGFITADNGLRLIITCNRNFFEVGDTITGQTSGATAVLTSVDTGSNIYHNYDRSACRLRIGTNSGDRAVRQSNIPIAYVAGKGQDPSLTFNAFQQKANVRVLIGVGNDYDGIFFEVTETEFAFIIRSSVSGSPSDANRVPQSEWNIDRLDGGLSGGPNPSGETLDISKAQFFSPPYLWQGTGPVYLGMMIDNRLIYCHEFKTANVSDVVYMRNPSLPVRYEIQNIGPTASPTEIEEICSTVSSEGGYTLPGSEISVDMGIIPRTVTVTGSPVLAIRLRNEFPAGKPNFRFARFLESSFQIAVNDALIYLLHVHDPLDVVATWTPISNDSGLEYSTNITSFIGRPTHKVKPVYAATGPANKPAIAQGDIKFINLHSNIAQNFYSNNSQIFMIWAQSQTGTSNILASVSLVEYE